MDKKAEIAEKAGEMFMRYGIKSVSMDDLSRELGVSKKTIYTYFTDKNVLVEFVLESKVCIIQQECQFALKVCENAIAELYQFINVAAQNMNSIHPSVIFDLQKYHPNGWKLIEKHEKEYVLPVIMENIVRGRQEGLYREDFDATTVAQIYVSINDSIFNRTIYGSGELSIAQILSESLRFILFGMATEKGKILIQKLIPYEK
jgi:TetR/AcrR family transcriptional regulator, cholesterol catabolism regulator